MTKRKTKEVMPTFQHAINIMSKAHEPYTLAYYAVECDYDTDYNCDEECCGDYCRCGVIVDAKIKSIDVDQILKKLIPTNDDVMASYCIDRVIRSSKMLDKGSWEVDICNGYYGQECRGGVLDSSVQKEIIDMLTKLETLSDLKRVRQLLIYEYGYLLPYLQEYNAVKIENIKLDQIKLFNREYQKKVSKKEVDYYADYQLPRAVCIMEGDQYTVIDGYHRMVSAHNQNLGSVSIIQLYKE